MKTLPKYILNKLTTSEKNKLQSLLDKHHKTGEKMVEVQAIASMAMRKETKEHPGQPWTAATQRKINQGFKYEMIAFKASDELKAYMEEMRKKY
uniref:Uncharacterized protein n=1 Tax=viral metagenome TaxID=1070528 RepID=A0A6C0KSM6_9ZZZZ